MSSILYKQAGNSIVVDVLEEIIKRFIIVAYILLCKEEENEDK